MIECNNDKFKQRCIGETKRSLAKRLSEHREQACFQQKQLEFISISVVIMYGCQDNNV
jgi:hypothetical protein